MTPLAPPGTKVVINSKPTNLASWDPNGNEGWYTGPSLNNYRCVKCYISTTGSEVNYGIVVFFPQQIDFPAVKIDAFITLAEKYIIKILANNPAPTVASATLPAKGI